MFRRLTLPACGTDFAEKELDFLFFATIITHPALA
jgi:hypothetical protein